MYEKGGVIGSQRMEIQSVTLNGCLRVSGVLHLSKDQALSFLDLDPCGQFCFNCK